MINYLTNLIRTAFGGDMFMFTSVTIIIIMIALYLDLVYNK